MDQQVVFNIPAESLDLAILQYSRQAGVQILSSSDVLAQRSAPALQGAQTPRAALSQLLRGTNLTFSVAGDDTVAIKTRGSAEGARSSNIVPAAYQSAPAPSPASAPLAEAPETAGPAAIDAIVVTGTRLQASGFTAPTPVTVTSSATIQERAKVNIQDVLLEMPAFQPSQGAAQSARNASGTQGASTVDLRGLGSGRTLVLLDGRRYVPVSTGGAPDVANIPTNLLDRVEIVTGGASAAYGSDAIAGVVNFILNDKLEGIKANAQYGFSQHGDDLEPALNFAVGHTFADGKIHVIAGVDYSKNYGVTSVYDRAWAAKEPGLLSLTGNRPAGTPANVLTDYVEYSGLTPGGLITSGPLKGTAFGAGGTPYQFPFGSLVGGSYMMGGPTNPNYGFNYASQQPLDRPHSRISSLTRINFDVTPDTTIFVEGSYSQTRVITKGFSAQMFGNATSGIPITANNAYLPASIAQALQTDGSVISTGGGNTTPGFYEGRLDYDLGGWGARTTNRVYRGVVGIKSELWKGWKLDAYFQYGETDEDNLFYVINTARFYQAAYAIKDGNGNITCGPTATNPYFMNQNAAARTTLLNNIGNQTCVPLNLFGTGLTQNGYAYVRQPYDQDVVTKQLVGSATINGSPFSTWAGPVSVAFGGEWRRDSVNQNGDNVAVTGGYFEYNGIPLNGSQGLYEGFAETGVPLMKDSMFGKSLDFNAAIRHTVYEYSGPVTTWKVGGVYNATNWLMVRATESQDIKAPTVGNLFSFGGGANWLVTNPTNGVTDTVQGVTNGNPNLQPEKAKTFTGGFVLTPKWGFLNGFRMSADYYNITVNNVIASLTPPQVVQRYYGGQTQYASYFTFDSTVPLGFSRISTVYANLNQLKTDGVDLIVDYRVPLSDFNIPGRLNVNVQLTWTDQLATFSTVGGVVSKANRVGGDQYADQAGPVPRYRSTVTFDYNNSRFGATVQARLFTGFIFGSQYVGPGQTNYSPTLSNSISDNYSPGLIYWSLALRYNVIQDGHKTLQLYGNVDNLFDKDPPITAMAQTTGGGIPYDYIGRTFHVGARFTM